MVLRWVAQCRPCYYDGTRNDSECLFMKILRKKEVVDIRSTGFGGEFNVSGGIL